MRTRVLTLAASLVLFTACGPDYPDCDFDGDCRRDEACIVGRCREDSTPTEACRTASECRANEVCSAGRCVASSPPPSSAETSCLDAYVCLAECQDQACAERCAANLRGQELEEARALDACLSRNCPASENNFACAAERCLREDRACFGGALSCSDGFDCTGRCRTQECSISCLYRTEAQQRVTYWSLLQCMERNGCLTRPPSEFEACYRSACSTEVAACGVSSGPPSATCRTLPAGSAPTTSAPFTCGPGNVLTEQWTRDLNAFWQSRMVSCACVPGQAPAACANNAFVLPAAPGYIYYDMSFLQRLAQLGTAAPAWFMAHEAGHNVQLAQRIGASSDKGRELGADCLAGYFFGWLLCTGRADGNSIMSAVDGACAVGDRMATPWFAPGAHGTCAERVQAVQIGLDAYVRGAAPSACVF